MGLFRELFLIIGFFMVQKLNVVDSKTYNCQYIPHLYILSMRNTTSCLASQLSDVSRYKLIDIFNKYRSDTANGLKSGGSTKYGNVFELNYHWICEYFAAFLITNNLGGTDALLSEEIVSKIVQQVKDTLIFPTDVNIELGSIGDVISFREYDFTTIIFREAVSSQPEFMSSLTEDISKLTDPYLTLEEEKRVWPGTTFFGCALRVGDPSIRRKRQKFTNSIITCVFATRPEADRDLTEGTMSEETCKDAKPEGTFDSDKHLCVDSNRMNLNIDDDIPCQPFYPALQPKSPLLLNSCNGVDPKTDKGFADFPEGYTVKRVNCMGKILQVLPTKSTPGRALKLHSIPMRLIVLIASINSIFRYFFTSVK